MLSLTFSLCLAAFVCRFLYVAGTRGHVAAATDMMVTAIVGVMTVAIVVLDVLRIASFPLRWATGNVSKDSPDGPKGPRRIVIFDGICVLCNRFGRFVVSRLCEPTKINFIPFQDPASNPHINLKRLQEEFKFEEAQLKDRIAVISDDKLLWGHEAVLEIFGWCAWPYPMTKLAKVLLPAPLCDALYMTVAKNRYLFFGTQPLDKNFAKKLCPYMWFKKK